MPRKDPVMPLSRCAPASTVNGRHGVAFLVAILTALASGCDPVASDDVASRLEEPLLQSERRGIGLEPVPEHTGPSAFNVTIDPRKSLAVTDQTILSRFPFQRVMDQLVAQSGVPGLTSLQLFQQWWDTANPAPGLGLGRHCNDEVTGGVPSLNSFPYACPRAEGAQASVDPFSYAASNPNAYIAVGLFNRIDLAPRDGTDCGEYRMIFAKRSGTTDNLNRNLLIFEAILPNPNPHQGLEGCRPVANFWRDLTTNYDVNSRGAALENFFFNGLPGFMPVVHIENYGSRTWLATGQVRSNQFMEANWLLREFKLRKECSGYSCALRFVPVTVKTNPAGTLFNPASSHPRAHAFQNDTFPRYLGGLTVNDVNRINVHIPDTFNSGESDSQEPPTSPNNYVAAFGTGPSTFRNNIQNKLNVLGSPLTPDNIVARTLPLSCAGCHQLSNGANLGGGLVWPHSLGFTHVSERNVDVEAGPDGGRFKISPALTGVFLPHRKAVFENLLNSFSTPETTETCGGTAGQWAGCRGTGCRVCTELVQDYPCYFDNHKGCIPNDICGSQYFTCSSQCPAPTSADACVTTQCGNGICDIGEDGYSCPTDCSTCGNGVCDLEENRYTCPDDCGFGGGCPDPRQINCEVQPFSRQVSER